MTPEQEQHLEKIKKEFTEKVDAKYRKGVKEHGGNLWEYSIEDLINMALDEAIDQYTYLSTLKRKLKIKD